MVKMTTKNSLFIITSNIYRHTVYLVDLKKRKWKRCENTAAWFNYSNPTRTNGTTATIDSLKVTAQSNINKNQLLTFENWFWIIQFMHLNEDYNPHPCWLSPQNTKWKSSIIIPGVRCFLSNSALIYVATVSKKVSIYCTKFPFNNATNVSWKLIFLFVCFLAPQNKNSR